MHIVSTSEAEEVVIGESSRPAVNNDYLNACTIQDFVDLPTMGAIPPGCEQSLSEKIGQL